MPQPHFAAPEDIDADDVDEHKSDCNGNAQEHQNQEPTKDERKDRPPLHEIASVVLLRWMQSPYESKSPSYELEHKEEGAERDNGKKRCFGKLQNGGIENPSLKVIHGLNGPKPKNNEAYEYANGRAEDAKNSIGFWSHAGQQDIHDHMTLIFQDPCCTEEGDVKEKVLTDLNDPSLRSIKKEPQYDIGADGKHQVDDNDIAEPSHHPYDCIHRLLNCPEDHFHLRPSLNNSNGKAGFLSKPATNSERD